MIFHIPIRFRQIPYREASYTDKITDKLEARRETIYVWGLHILIIAVIIEIEKGFFYKKTNAD